MSDSGVIQTKAQFEDSPEGWARRWQVELAATDDALKEWWKRGNKVLDRYVDERTSENGARHRLNLFHGDIETKRALLYGNPPRVRCRRRHADADDDVARVSAELLERILNSDIERDGDGFVEALGLARDDRLLPGMGVVRARYTVEMEDVPEEPAKAGECPDCGGFGTVAGADEDEADCMKCSGSGSVELAPAVPATKNKAEEDCETGYVQWEDFRWSVLRTWQEVYWVAFKAEMTRDALHERFDSVEWMGPERVEGIPMKSQRKEYDEQKETDPWSRATVWEIWNKQDRRVYWYVPGFDVVLDIKDDPLGLDGFFPCPRPLFANATTRKLIPVPDFTIAQDLYDEIDDLYDRIVTLTETVRMAGALDQQNAAVLGSILEGGDNKMYPVASWAAFQERGGLKGAMEFMPVAEIAQAIAVLTEKLREKILLKDQVTGIADVMRGGSSTNATATEQRIKARFGSTRIQAAQDEFARFTTETQKIRAEIIAKWWDVETILERSNFAFTGDAQDRMDPATRQPIPGSGMDLGRRAAELIKQGTSAYRIEVASDALAMTDFDALKGDRVEFLTATGAFLQQIGTIAATPAGMQSVPYLLEFLKHGVTGFRGAAQLEGVLDRMVGAAQQAAQQAAMAPKQPDPQMQKAKIDLETTKMEAGAKAQQTRMDLEVSRAEHGMKLREMAAEQQRDMMRAALPQPQPGGAA
jgi:hypothetical protein